MKKLIIFLLLIQITSTTQTGAGMLIEDGFVSANVPKTPALPMGDDRRVFNIYLPPNYATSTDRYPVVYYLPGLGTFAQHNSLATGNSIVLDEIICDNTVVPMIVVHIDPTTAGDIVASTLTTGTNPDGRTSYLGSWYVNSILNGNFEDYIIDELVPYVDAQYRTKASAGFRAIGGQSMGGHGALFLGTRHPDVFSAIASESGTTFWAYITTDLAQPGDQAFFVNSLILPEIPTSGPNTGKIDPSNGTGTFTIFSHASALSPNITGGNSFIDTFYVDLPFLVNPDGTPQTTPGTFFGTNTTTGDPLTFTESLILDMSVVNRWKEKDPFFLMDSAIDTLKQQTLFLDAGALEPANNTGAKIYSDKLVDHEIDHEYLLNQLNHSSALLDRNQTLFQLFSAHFSAAGNFSDDIRTKIIGTGSLILQNGATMPINDGDIIGIETSPDFNVANTNITISIRDNSSVTIGTNTTTGGALQIGNNFSKARSVCNATLAAHEVRGTIEIDGDNALLEIGIHGFLGLACGADGQNPNQPNFFGISSLTNVKDIQFDIKQGTFRHDQITSGLNTNASLFAIGANDNFTFEIDPERALICGGGNLIAFPDAWRTHPLIENTPGTLTPGGERDIISTDPNAMDYFYNQPIASNKFYTDKRMVGILSSSEQLDDRTSSNPFELANATSLNTIFNYFDANTYESEVSKEAAIGSLADQICIGYLDTSAGDNIIVRINQDELPVGTNQEIDYNKILKTGTIGLWVEEIDGVRHLIRAYDLKPDEDAPTAT